MVGHEKVIMVVSGALVFNKEQELLLQLRSDDETWGIPGGFMDLGESVQDTAKRELFEETGLILDKMELFGVYSGPDKEKTFANGDQVSVVIILFVCHDFHGTLIEKNAETKAVQFFPLDQLPSALFVEHQPIIKDLLANKALPVIG